MRISVEIRIGDRGKIIRNRIKKKKIFLHFFAGFLLFVSCYFSSVVCFAKDKDFRQLCCEHFIINYHKDVGRPYALKIKDTAEKFYRVITQEFHLVRDKLWVWENRAKIFIAKDRDSYIKSFDCSPWSAACVDLKQKIIYTYPEDSRFISVFVHELTHIIFREYAGTNNLPLWLDEGIAVYMENKYGGDFYRNRLSFLKKKIENNDHISLSRLVKITPQELAPASDDYVNLFYTESFSIVNFIIKKYGRHNFSRFLTYLKKGYSLKDALAKVFLHLRDLDELEKRWKRFYQE